MKVSNIEKYWKAVVGFMAPGASVLVYALTDGEPGVTQDQWILVVAACFVTGGAVLATPNKKKEV